MFKKKSLYQVSFYSNANYIKGMGKNDVHFVIKAKTQKQALTKAYKNLKKEYSSNYTQYRVGYCVIVS